MDYTCFGSHNERRLGVSKTRDKEFKSKCCCKQPHRRRVASLCGHFVTLCGRFSSFCGCLIDYSTIVASIGGSVPRAQKVRGPPGQCSVGQFSNPSIHSGVSMVKSVVRPGINVRVQFVLLIVDSRPAVTTLTRLRTQILYLVY